MTWLARTVNFDGATAPLEQIYEGHLGYDREDVLDISLEDDGEFLSMFFKQPLSITAYSDHVSVSHHASAGADVRPLSRLARLVSELVPSASVMRQFSLVAPSPPSQQVSWFAEKVVSSGLAEAIFDPDELAAPAGVLYATRPVTEIHRQLDIHGTFATPGTPAGLYVEITDFLVPTGKRDVRSFVSGRG